MMFGIRQCVRWFDTKVPLYYTLCSNNTVSSSGDCRLTL
eukprot:COSAG02_NODE_62864_length_264_cov_1.793939_1_plen_38_part_01